MSKIKNLFKASPIAMIVIGLVIAGIAGAAIVSYISNAPAATVTVSAPVAMGIYEGIRDDTKAPSATSLLLTPTFGGSSMSFTTTAKNQANNRIGGYYVTVVDAGTGNLMTGKEFTSVMFNKNKAPDNPQNGEIINKLCVVEGNGSLITLAAYEAAGRSNQKLALLFDVDGASTQVSDSISESTGICSPLTLYGDSPSSSWTETRSFFHLDAGETETWTFTPTWYAGTTGSFTISARYVNDLKAYAAGVYGGTITQ